MVRVGQRIDDLEFEFYQNDDIKKGKFSDYPGKWLVLLFYPADFTFTRFRSRQEHTFAEKLLSAMRYSSAAMSSNRQEGRRARMKAEE
jgi:peroxiredoxin